MVFLMSAPRRAMHANLKKNKKKNPHRLAASMTLPEKLLADSMNAAALPQIARHIDDASRRKTVSIKHAMFPTLDHRPPRRTQLGHVGVICIRRRGLGFATAAQPQSIPISDFSHSHRQTGDQLRPLSDAHEEDGAKPTRS